MSRRNWQYNLIVLLTGVGLVLSQSTSVFSQTEEVTNESSVASEKMYFPSVQSGAADAISSIPSPELPGSSEINPSSEGYNTIVINAMRAVPRWGNNACWVDNGGRLKNTCSTAQLLSFMPEHDLWGKTVTANIASDAAFAAMKCQHVSMGVTLTNYWVLGPSSSSGNKTSGISTVWLNAWQVPKAQYQIDCMVPAGVTMVNAIIW
jgi:hypothetical protein